MACEKQPTLDTTKDEVRSVAQSSSTVFAHSSPAALCEKSTESTNGSSTSALVAPLGMMNIKVCDELATRTFRS